MSLLHTIIDPEWRNLQTPINFLDSNSKCTSKLHPMLYKIYQGHSLLFALIIFSIIICCTPPQPEENEDPNTEHLAHVPDWAKEAIWYQIFVERFRNGDPTNDPTAHDISGGYPFFVPENWTTTPWGHDWYQPDDWFGQSLDSLNFHSIIQLRRFGGDLQGVIDKLDYLQNLGVNAIYFNPLNDSPSLHKYDPRNYRHIDRNFGPDPEGDERIASEEIPDDPSTWQWTSADSLFLQLVNALHQRGMRVIMDYSWNHTGNTFWALKDIREKGKESRFVDWYNISSFDDPSTPQNEFDYEGWAGSKSLPVFKKDIVGEDEVFPFKGNLHSESLKQHIYNVSRRWLDPNGDGDPGDGVDGYRLDVAAEVPMGFWVDYRKQIRAVNPDAVLIGEIWWQTWPDELMDPRPFLQGDMFDAIMNYRWYKIARGFFAQAEPVLNATELVTAFEGINRDIAKDNLLAMMNLGASHDAPRTSTSLFNKGKYKYRVKPGENPDYKIHKPGERTRAEQKMLLINQFTFPGAPHIWYGDEVGMWGGDDPDCRKPMIWDDIEYKNEIAHISPNLKRPIDEVSQDKALLEFYQELIQIRKENPVLNHGDLTFLNLDHQTTVVAYSRHLDDTEIISVFNRSEDEQVVTLKTRFDGQYKDALDEKSETLAESNALEVSVSAVSARVLIKQ